MKLIDILVQELPKRGGWPEGVTSLCQGHDRQLERLEGDDSFDMNVFIEPLIKEHRKWAFTASECDAEIVTREQYEAALKQSVWDGTGLPPVGSLCRYRAYTDTPWIECKVLSYHENEVWLQRTSDCVTFIMGNPHLHPVRSKRDEAIDEIASMIGRGTFYEDAERIYDAITSGALKLSD